jgi:hypothetical protein
MGLLEHAEHDARTNTGGGSDILDAKIPSTMRRNVLFGQHVLRSRQALRASLQPRLELVGMSVKKTDDQRIGIPCGAMTSSAVLE